MHNAEAVSLDVTGTLVDGRSVKYFWDVLIPSAYARKHRVPFEKAFSNVKQMYGTISPDDVRWYLPEYWMKKLGIEESIEELLRELKPLITIFPDVKPVIAELSSNHSLIVSSNLPMLLLETVLDDFKKYFLKVFSSVSTYSLPRKTAEFYVKVCSDAGFKPREILHVGDNFIYDFLIPRFVGIKSLIIKRFKLPRRKHEVSNLKQVLDRIKLGDL
ncbi:MAG: HAD family hydrolase [Candidatus Brockarchaeota archaeon]|nr:HAD family hydrolase [Candidatus Brockarchaeota archaeon]